jgi:hypothetical protein
VKNGSSVESEGGSGDGRLQGGERGGRGRTGECLDGSYPKGMLGVVRRGRTNVEQAPRQLDLRAGQAQSG